MVTTEWSDVFKIKYFSLCHAVGLFSLTGRGELVIVDGKIEEVKCRATLESLLKASKGLRVSWRFIFQG